MHRLAVDAQRKRAVSSAGTSTSKAGERIGVAIPAAGHGGRGAAGRCRHVWVDNVCFDDLQVGKRMTASGRRRSDLLELTRSTLTQMSRFSGTEEDVLPVRLEDGHRWFAAGMSSICRIGETDSAIFDLPAIAIRPSISANLDAGVDGKVPAM